MCEYDCTCVHVSVFVQTMQMCECVGYVYVDCVHMCTRANVWLCVHMYMHVCECVHVCEGMSAHVCVTVLCMCAHMLGDVRV